jgi:DNA (cytosine-5)-methyltransferase 1
MTLERLVEEPAPRHLKDEDARPSTGAASNGTRQPDVDELDLEYLRSDSRPEDLNAGDPIEIVDLFSGCGGMTLGAIEGARRAGCRGRLALAVDHEEEALDVLARTLDASDACAVADLEEVLQPLAEAESPEEHELFEGIESGGLLLAGPPCQGHSGLNNHTRHDDPRNDLYLAVARAARLLEPKAVIIENVKSIANDRRSSVARCVAALEELGYEVDSNPRDLHAVGVPQRRPRHVVVATLNQPFEWNLPDCGSRTVRWAIQDLLKKEPIGRDAAPAASNENRRRIDWLFDNRKYNLPNTERPDCHQSDHTYISMYGRLKWDEPAQTITTGFTSMGQGRYVHPAKRRALTHHEAARLQFLPDFVDFGELRGRRGAVATMIGNAAPPKLTMGVVEALIAQGLL